MDAAGLAHGEMFVGIVIWPLTVDAAVAHPNGLCVTTDAALIYSHARHRCVHFPDHTGMKTGGPDIVYLRVGQRMLSATFRNLTDGH